MSEHVNKNAVDFHGLRAASNCMKSIVATVEKVRDCDATVLIQGESGTGKEVIARAIHKVSPRHDKPFVIINCATIVDTLMESELFGHERGSFTGAHERTAGKFELADRGTAFLDEVSELPLPLQPKLLRIIQEKEFTRVGGTRPLNTDIRIVAATNRDLSAMVEEGTFREDLFYRLRVVQICIPPLRERPEDVPVLAEHFLAKFARRHGRDVRGFDTEAMERLMAFHWPGNVRDLEHVIERAVIMSDNSTILPGDIVFEEDAAGALSDAWDYEDALTEFNKSFLLKALTVAKGNKRLAARTLGISHARLYRLLAKYDLAGTSH